MSVELAGFHHRFVPPPGDSSLTLLLLHGTGGNEDDLLDLGRTIAPQAALLSPRGRVLERGMPRFFRRLAEGVFDEDDLLQRTTELAQFIRAACSTYQREAKHVVAVGFSNGANIAAALLFKHPESLGGAVLMRAMVPFQSDVPAPLHRKPILMLSSRNDPIVAIPETERLAALFQSADADLTLQWNVGGHNLVQSDVVAAAKWINDLPSFA